MKMVGLKKIFWIFILAAGLWLVTAASVNAQNFADIGGAVTDSTLQGDESLHRDLDSLQPPTSQEVQNKIKAMVDESQIPDLPMKPSVSTYTLGPTDIIEITVMRHPEVSGEFVINMEGKIQYEFVGDVKIAGKTKDEATVLIKEKLSKFIIDPDVSVKITGYNSKIVYVVGEVSLPGKIFMRGDTITVREALMQAGLPMLTGITKKSKLITPSDDGAAEQKEINVYALLYEGDLRENEIMHPGDVLYIPPTFLTKTIRTLRPVAEPIGTAAGTARTVTFGF